MLTRLRSNNFAQVVDSGKQDDLINKFDQQVDAIAKRVASKKVVVPEGNKHDIEIASKATSALLAYTEAERAELDPNVSEVLTSIIGSGRKMSAPLTAVFDSAVDNLYSTLVSKPSHKSLYFPNYEVYDFTMAVFQIITNDWFEISSIDGIETALKCAAGMATFCTGFSNKMNDSVVELMSRLGALFLPNVLIHQSLPKAVFMPMYIFLNHKSIPIEIREFIVRLLRAGVELLENAPIDNQQAFERYLNDAISRVRFTGAETAMLMRIEKNLRLIISRMAKQQDDFVFLDNITGSLKTAFTNTLVHM